MKYKERLSVWINSRKFKKNSRIIEIWFILTELLAVGGFGVTYLICELDDGAHTADIFTKILHIPERLWTCQLLLNDAWLLGIILVAIIGNPLSWLICYLLIKYTIPLNRKAIKSGNIYEK